MVVHNDQNVQGSFKTYFHKAFYPEIYCQILICHNCAMKFLLTGSYQIYSLDFPHGHIQGFNVFPSFYLLALCLFKSCCAIQWAQRALLIMANFSFENSLLQGYIILIYFLLVPNVIRNVKGNEYYIQKISCNKITWLRTLSSGIKKTMFSILCECLRNVRK